ncbi:MAG: hypothetical protein FJ096_05700 [Deltaproteobacteria bacterium]|nr:hypothetical protein [Deltaproteobacteria bacterium]
MRLMRLLASLALTTSTAGCSLQLSGEIDEVRNQCVTDGDCPGGACASDGSESFCVATKADLANLFFEFHLPNDAPVGPGLRGVQRASALGVNLQGTDEGGFLRTVQLALPLPIEVGATLSIAPLPAECGTLEASGTVPASIELHPVGQPLGVSLAPYVAGHDPEFGGPRLTVSPGRYDIVLEPEVTSLKGCSLPRVLLRDQLIESYTELHFSRGEPSVLRGHLDVPHALGCDTDALACWRVELLENQRGRSIGSATTFAAEGAEGTETFEVRFWPGGKDAGTPVDPVLVVHPPQSLRQLGMPDLFWKLGAIDPDGDLDVSLELAPLVAGTQRFIPLEASVRGVDGEPVAANVLLVGRQLLGGKFGDNALFQAAVATDEGGNFAVNILPGKYDLVAIPGGESDHAVTIETWTFADTDLGKGRTFEVKPVSRLNGSVTTPRGDAASNVLALVSPAATQDVSLLEALFSPGQASLLAALPRIAANPTDGGGRFDLPLDPGLVDLFVKPAASSNLPWLVRPSISVSASQPQPVDLGDLQFSEPVVLLGRFASEDGSAIPGVTLRAWLGAVDEGGEARPRAIGLGEVTSDASGHYRLLLPSSASQ